MKISVIVTTYNRPDALARVLDGLHHQLRPADEVVVADDGSGEQTAKVVHQFDATFSGRLHHVWHEDRGFRAARIRNIAIRESTGDYLVLLDGDCIPERHFVGDHGVLAEPGFFFQGKRVLVKKRLSRVFDHQDANTLRNTLLFALRREISNCHHILRLPRFPAYVRTGLRGVRSCNMGVFRQDLYAVNGFNEDFVGWGREDSELVVRLYKRGLKRKEHPFMAACFHLWHEDNDRGRLRENDALLIRAIESKQYACTNGLVKP